MSDEYKKDVKLSKPEMVMKAIDLLNESLATNGDETEFILVVTTPKEKDHISGIESCTGSFEKSVVTSLMKSGIKRMFDRIGETCDCDNCRKESETSANPVKGEG